MTDSPGSTPLPITFLGLAIASMVYAGYETGVVPRADFHTVGWLVVAVPVPMQLLAAIWGLIRGELGASTGSAVLAATWLGVSLATITGSPGASGPTKAESMVLFASAAGLLVSVATELVDSKLLAAAVLTVTALRFTVTGVSGLTHSHAWTTAAGVVGFVLAAVALAGAATIELQSALGRRC